MEANLRAYNGSQVRIRFWTFWCEVRKNICLRLWRKKSRDRPSSQGHQYSDSQLTSASTIVHLMLRVYLCLSYQRGISLRAAAFFSSCFSTEGGRGQIHNAVCLKWHGSLYPARTQQTSAHYFCFPGRESQVVCLALKLFIGVTTPLLIGAQLRMGKIPPEPLPVTPCWVPGKSPCDWWTVGFMKTLKMSSLKEDVLNCSKLC